MTCTCTSLTSLLGRSVAVTVYTVRVRDSESGCWRTQYSTVDPAEAVGVVLAMRRELPGIDVVAVGHQVTVPLCGRVVGEA